MDNYSEQLDRVSSAIIEMLSNIKEMFAISQNAIKDINNDYYKIATEKDTEVNKLDHEIEVLALNILKYRTPMAMDLRKVTSSLKISSYLENIGDLVKRITRKIYQPNIEMPKKEIKNFDLLSNKISDMLNNIILSFKSQDIRILSDIFKQENQIDELYQVVFNDFCQIIQEDVENVNAYVHMIGVAKNYERIGDYLVRISALIYYIETNEYLNTKF